MGYVVKKLDRVLFANLDKRKLKKGEWRMLTEKELRVLKNSVGLK
jgi:23S rRNA pseudouridine2605 synthase